MNCLKFSLAAAGARPATASYFSFGSDTAARSKSRPAGDRGLQQPRTAAASASALGLLSLLIASM
eukprot:4828473-Pyramimonas_sp.AAC.3